jgi:XTP/dITP diphosphohydrolase
VSRRLTGPLVVATHNRGKLEEIAALLAPWPVQVLSAADLGLPEPAETEATFLGNARIKAHAAARASGLPALADDSGLEVDALGGAPGVHTADWAATADGRDFVQAMTRTWAELERLAAPCPRTARFRCTLVLAWPDGHEEVFEGRIEGQCVWPMRGDQGHGYDPMFRPDGYSVTLGQMDRWDKNRISHRADAFGKMAAACLG